MIKLSFFLAFFQFCSNIFLIIYNRNHLFFVNCYCKLILHYKKVVLYIFIIIFLLKYMFPINWIITARRSAWRVKYIHISIKHNFQHIHYWYLIFSYFRISKYSSVKSIAFTNWLSNLTESLSGIILSIWKGSFNW